MTRPGKTIQPGSTTQGFFARLLKKEWLADFDPDKGKFRTFLLVALNRFAHTDDPAIVQEELASLIAVFRT